MDDRPPERRADDWLLAAPEQSELDERGCFSHEAIVDIEHQLREAAADDLDQFDSAPALVTTVADDRWALVSMLQKAVRFEKPGAAAWAADQLTAHDPTALTRRMSIIAIEDVMAADPTVTATTLAVLADRQWIAANDRPRVMRWLAARLAAAPGDRSAAEVLDCAHSDPLVNWTELDQLTEHQMVILLSDLTVPIPVRSAITQLMAGPQFAIGNMPKTRRRPTRLFQHMVESGSSRWGCFVAARGASVARNVMWTQTLFIDHWLRTERPRMVLGPQFPTPSVQGILLAAYDCHTRMGIQAIRAFGKVPAVARVLAGVVPEHRKEAIEDGVFYGEGGVVRRRVVYGPESQAVWEWIRRGPEWVRWVRPELAPLLIPTVIEEIDQLNAHRRRLLGLRPPQPEQMRLLG